MYIYVAYCVCQTAFCLNVQFVLCNTIKLYFVLEELQTWSAIACSFCILQLKILMSKKEADVPLYLSLACEELRMFGLFEKVSQLALFIVVLLYVKTMNHRLTRFIYSCAGYVNEDHCKIALIK